MPSQSLLPPIPTTAEMAAIEPLMKLELDTGIIGDLYNPAACPAHLLEAMYAQFGALPLYWAENADEVTRSVYAGFYLSTPGIIDGILPNKGGERALALFSDRLGLAYHYTWRRSSTDGRKVGLTFYLTPLGVSREYYEQTPGGQAYLERAYAFLLPARVIIDDIIFTEQFDAQMGLTAHIRNWGFTP